MTGDVPAVGDSPVIAEIPAAGAPAATGSSPAVSGTPGVTAPAAASGSPVVAAQAAVSASPTRTHWAIFVGLAAGVAILDQIVKAWIVGNFEVDVPVNVIGDWARIVLTHNNGALFGMFKDQAIVFAAFSLLVIGLIVAFEARAGSSLLITIALGLLLGGAIGNLTDRVRLGYVVDFVDLGIGSWRFYAFNLADSAISLSILLLLVLAIRPPRQVRSRD